MHLYEVLRRPLITEKSTVLQTQNKYAFEIADGANKLMIKQAVQKACIYFAKNRHAENVLLYQEMHYPEK